MFLGADSNRYLTFWMYEHSYIQDGGRLLVMGSRIYSANKHYGTLLYAAS